MELTEYEIKKLLDSGIIEVEKLGHKKGATMIFYHGNHYYVWKENDRVILQKKWFWSKKNYFEILSCGTKVNAEFEFCHKCGKKLP